MTTSPPRLRTIGRLALLMVMSAAVHGCASTTPQGSAEQRAADQAAAGQVLLDEGRLDAALAAFGLALESNPELLEAHLGMGSVYQKRSDYRLAADSYERAAGIDPESFDAHYYLALSRQFLGQVEAAIRAYLMALTLRPDDPDANQNLASAYLQSNRPGEALPYAKRAVDLNEQSQGGWANLASVYSLLGRHEESVDAYRRAAELGDTPPPLLVGWADAHIQLEQYGRAINILKRALQMQATARVWERLGYAYFKQRELSDARDAFGASLKLDGRHVGALNGLGVVLMSQYLLDVSPDVRLRNEAVRVWKKSLSQRPGQAVIRQLLDRYRDK